MNKYKNKKDEMKRQLLARQQQVQTQNEGESAGSSVQSGPASVTLVVNTEADKASVEETFKKAEAKKTEADSYYSERKAKADAYYEEKKTEADALSASLKQQKEQLANNNDVERKSIISKANEEADAIRRTVDSEKESAIEKAKAATENEVRKNAESKQKELDEAIERQNTENLKLTEKTVELQNAINAAESAVHEKFRNEFGSLNQEIESLRKQMGELKLQLNKAELELAGEKQVTAFYRGKCGESQQVEADRLQLNEQIEKLQSDNQAYVKLLEEKKEELEKCNAILIRFGDDPEEMEKKLNQLEHENVELKNAQSQYPDEEELDRLRKDQVKLADLQRKYAMLEDEKNGLEKENGDLSYKREELDNTKRLLKIMDLQRAELQSALDKVKSNYESKVNKVFANLSKIDEQFENNEIVPLVTSGKRSCVTLRDLCTDFRAYMATRDDHVKLYYDDMTVRTFIAGFASSRLIILQGLSGTGKSSLPAAFQDFMGATTIYVPVQSSWKDRNDLLGFYNDFKKQYKETEFLKAIYQATQDRSRVYCIVLDEMNLSRIEYYFADMLSVLENGDTSKWQVELVSDSESIGEKGVWPHFIKGGKLTIGANTWFIGTANEDDSTQTITDKVYDRAVVINFEEKGRPMKGVEKQSPITIGYDQFEELLNKASQNWRSGDEERFESMISDLDRKVRDKFGVTFGNRIENQLEKFVPTYVECGGTVDEAVDVMFSRKVLRKMDGLYDDATKKGLEEFKEYIIKCKYELNLTKSQIDKMIKRIS